MIVVETRMQVLKSLQAWYPDDPGEVEALLCRAPVVSAMQCSAAVADALERWTFRRRAFHTSLIDLTQTEDQLWERLERKTCRYQINKAKKLDPVVTVNEHTDDAYRLFVEFIRRNPYREPLTPTEWRRITSTCDVFIARHHGRAMATHVILAEAPRYARALMSATACREDPAERTIAGALNRYLHWHEFGYYRSLGVRCYDLGGMVRDPSLPEWSIAQFKALFGGTDTTHEVVHLARNPVLRASLRAVSRRRGENPASRPAGTSESPLHAV